MKTKNQFHIRNKDLKEVFWTSWLIVMISQVILWINYDSLDDTNYAYIVMFPPAVIFFLSGFLILKRKIDKSYQ